MSSQTIASALQNCPLDFSSCPQGIDTDCVVKLTLDCFSRMNSNLIGGGKKVPGEQSGGGPNDFNPDSIIPYLIGHNISRITRNTMVPEAILHSVKDERTGSIDLEIRAGNILFSRDIQRINEILSARPDSY